MASSILTALLRGILEFSWNRSIDGKVDEQNCIINLSYHWMKLFWIWINLCRKYMCLYIYIYNLQLRSMKLIKLMIQNSFSQVSERLVSFWHFLKDGFRSSEIVINSLHQRQRWNLNHLERSGESVLHKGTFFKTHIHHWLSGRQALFP